MANRGNLGDTGPGHGRHDEWHDPITGLPQPRSFLDHLDQVLATPGRPPHSIAMLLLRVANFDALRARIGQPSSDELLRIIAERLHEGVPEPNLVTRLCAGDFAIVLRDLGPEMTAETLATRLLERASERCSSGDRVPECAVVGALVVSAGRQESAMQLLERAIQALIRARLRSPGQAD